MAKSLSMTTGWRTPSSRAARRTLSRSCSNPNSGACTPTTRSPRSRYLSSHALRYGRVRSQLTHEYVQKSTATTRPRSPSAVSGSELSQRAARSSAERRLWVLIALAPEQVEQEQKDVEDVEEEAHDLAERRPTPVARDRFAAESRVLRGSAGRAHGHHH